MKIFIMAYARENIGDDLFLYMLISKYPQVDFYMNIPDGKYSKVLNKFHNINIMNKPDTDAELKNFNLDDYDAFVYIGGSIFMEGGKVYNLSEDFYEFMKKCKINNKPFFYISSNFGPYQTQEYFNLAKKNFKECTDICFRDKYSYKLFEQIPTVRYAPDLVFSYEVSDYKKIEKTVGISVIDLNIRKDLKENQQIYHNMLINNIKKYVEEGFDIYLYSFCKYEGDEESISEIMSKLSDDIKQSVHVVNYDGDLEKYLDLYKKMEYMICARFHAIILSIVFRQKYYIMSYSNKINNVIEDLELGNKYTSFYNLKEDELINLDKFNKLTNEHTKELKIKARKQLEKLDEFIMGN